MLPTSTRMRKMTDIRRRKADIRAQIQRVRVARLIWAGVAWELSLVRVRSEPGWSWALSMSLDGSDFLRPNMTADAVWFVVREGIDIFARLRRSFVQPN